MSEYWIMLRAYSLSVMCVFFFFFKEKVFFTDILNYLWIKYHNV